MPPATRIRYVREAAKELKTAAYWYEEQRKGLGSAFILSVEASLAKIKRNNEMFPIVDGSTRRALLKRFPYGIFYEIERDTIVVTAVFHSKRNPDSIKHRE